MPAKVWIRRGAVTETDGLERAANQHLEEVAARGGRLLNSFFAVVQSGSGTPVTVLTLVYDDPGEPQSDEERRANARP